MEVALTKFYDKYAPHMVPKVSSVLKTFENRLPELQDKCKQKYGAAPAFPKSARPASAKPASARLSSARPSSAKPKSAKPKLSERDEWLRYFRARRCGQSCKAGEGEVPLPAKTNLTDELENGDADDGGNDFIVDLDDDFDDDGAPGSKESLVDAWGSELSHAPVALRADAEVVFAAVERFGGNVLKWAAPELCADKSFLLKCAQVSGNQRRDMWEKSPLNFAAPELFADRIFMLELVQADGDALYHVAPGLRCDKELVLSAAHDMVNPRVLGDFEAMCADRDVILAFADHGESVCGALQMAHVDLLRNKEFMLAMVSRDAQCLDWLSMEHEELGDKWAADPDIARALEEAMSRQ